jgi:hypothetical protein
MSLNLAPHYRTRMASTLFLGALALGSAGIVTAYISKQYLDRSCPRIPISKVSRLSACRQLVDRACDSSSDADVPKPWGADKSGLLPSWSEARSWRQEKSLAAILRCSSGGRAGGATGILHT